MDYGKYQKLLTEKIETAFTKWSVQKTVSESELYAFLHTLKGTSGTIGLTDLAEFCSAHLEILSKDDDASIPVSSLKNFKKNIRLLAAGNEKKDRGSLIPAVYSERFDRNTFVLVIDDDLEFVSFVKDLLEQLGAQVLVAMNGMRGIQQFYDMKPNMLMIDMQLPDMTGTELFGKIRDTANDRHVISMLMSSEQTNKIMIEAYRSGMMDFIQKPLDLTLFLPYLFNRDMLRKKISQSITTDGLTGAGNRKRLTEMLDHALRVHERTGDPFSVVMVDLDHFKHVNDTYGHHTGDEVLRRFSDIAKTEKRETDSIFRFGGEEFVILVNGHKGEAYTFAERLHTAFNEQEFEAAGGSFSVTFSAGIAEYTHELETLLIEADQALYEAKRSGRNRTAVYESGTAQVKRKLQVIIIDDDLLIRTMLEEQLAQWRLPDIELSVRLFEDGVTFLRTDWYDEDTNFIILLDGVMPGMDGLEVLEQLKKRSELNNVLVSMMTARASEEDIKEALALGADDYLTKPFRNKDMLARIQNLASRMF
ncbi:MULTISPECIES: diguanylate cyclase [Sporosarcina]|uniref:diguanylate cyclase n=1 Tax=Sporosarcina TaxID=1569 RepID=UPI00058D669E|nr:MULTISPECIES: diguanylate cyclase [Sporosarcina]WJY27059.1 diguanylate cyclase [Sporosarcina sp. 0.2-SM1T-5]